MPRRRRHWLALLGALAVLGQTLGMPPANVLAGNGTGDQRAPGDRYVPEELLMTEPERQIFRALDFSETRARFLEQFWLQRETAVRAAWTKRLQLATNEFGSLTSQRARVFLTAGAPQYRLADLCAAPVARHEIWVYEEGVHRVVFVEASSESAFEIWREGDWQSLLAGASLGAGDGAPRDSILEDCPRGREFLAALTGGKEPPPLEGLGPRRAAWVEEFLEQTTLLPAGARPLEAAVEVGYPASVGDRTAVVFAFELPRRSIDRRLDFLLTGEISGEQSTDGFRLELAATPRDADEPVRLTARRHLAPGTYRAVLRLHDLEADAYLRTAVALDVPTLEHQDQGWIDRGERLFKLLPPPEGYLTGSQRFSTISSDPGIAKVRFFLDGERVLTKNRPPFSAELDLGVVPRPREIEAIAFDSKGYEVARDRMLVNSGPHRFAIRLIAPYRGERTDSETRIHAEVETPLGEQLSHVDFFWNEERLARLFQPPFVQTLQPPASAGSAYVRAVAVLDDGHSAEDLVVVNTGDTIEAIDVDFVELYASVRHRDGSVITGVEGDEFHVFENGVEQRVRRFETVENLPISAVVVLDSSNSMVEEIRDAEKAAAQFFEDVIEPKDRAAVIVFSHTPVLRVPLTNDLVLLENGLVGIEADGETSLYDSLIYGLYYLTGLRGKRALILLSDGADSISRFSFEEALEFARRSGVAIYAIGLGLASNNAAEHTILRKLAGETGGECFFIESARRLDRIYARIEEDLRSQYLLGYQSPQLESKDYREIRVEVDREGLEVKTVPGYYP